MEKTFCLHTLQLFLHNSWQPQEAHAETLRREAFQLQTVQLFLHENGCPKDTHANTFGRKTFRLHTVQLLLHTSWESQDTLAESFTLKETNSEWKSHFTITLWNLCRLLFSPSFCTVLLNFDSEGTIKKTKTGKSASYGFVCKRCNYSSTQDVILKRHKLKHSGERPFVCAQCNFSCTQTGYLKRHMLKHSGEKLQLQLVSSRNTC